MVNHIKTKYHEQYEYTPMETIAQLKHTPEHNHGKKNMGNDNSTHKMTMIGCLYLLDLWFVAKVTA